MSFRLFLLLFLIISSFLVFTLASPIEPSEFSWLRSKRQYWGFGAPDGTGSTWQNAANGGLSLFGRKESDALRKLQMQ